MKKLIFIVSLIFILCSCQHDEISDNAKVANKITYFRDSTTNLCFAALNSSTYGGLKVTSITCVPCDSIKSLSSKK